MSFPIGHAAHPAQGCTKAQREAFESIAIGICSGFSPKTLNKLLERGLIERDADKVLGRDRFGVIALPQYFVPLHLHAQWCQWCSENVSSEL